MNFDPFYLWLGVALVIIIAAGYVWEKGLLGTATEARIKTFIAKAKHEVEVWEKRLAEKQAQGVTGSTKEQRLDENDALLAKGKISQAEHDAARTVILND